MANHSFLSPSAASRWIACTPSAKFSSQFPETPSPYAEEGTEAHSLCEYFLKNALKMDAGADPRIGMKFGSTEMEEHACDYVDFVLDEYYKAQQNCKDAAIFIEKKLDLTEFIPEGYGFGDCIIVSDGLLEVIDFKYGQGVEVSAQDNAQMKCYALGALSQFGTLFEVENIRMAIFQPRMSNISISEISRTELETWAEIVLRPKAMLAYKGEGPFISGEHCKFCKAKAICRKRAETNLEIAKYDFAMPETISNLEIAAILEKADEVVSWVEDVKEYALKKALEGQKFEGFKLVEGRSVRKYADEEEVARKVLEAGKDPYEKSVIGISKMEKLLGKKEFSFLLGDLVTKPKGKPTLVQESDRREEMVIDAKNDFESMEVKR